MMSALELALILILATTAAFAVGFAGIIGWRIRSQCMAELGRLADELAAQRPILEAILTRLDACESRPARIPAEPASRPKDVRRVDRATPEPRPTLIAVPDLTSMPADPAPASASAELGRRFGAIWELAEAGTSADAIARATGQPIGQVELILGLRRQLESAASGFGSGSSRP